MPMGQLSAAVRAAYCVISGMYGRSVGEKSVLPMPSGGKIKKQTVSSCMKDALSSNFVTVYEILHFFAIYITSLYVLCNDYTIYKVAIKRQNVLFQLCVCIKPRIFNAI